MNKEYFQKRPEFRIHKKNSDYNIEMTFFAYERYYFKSIIKRLICISENSVKIKDCINSKNKTKYTSFFHFNKLNFNYIDKNLKDSNKLENNLYSFEVLTDKCSIKIDKKYYSNQYLLENECISLQLDKNINKNDEIDYILKFK